MSTSVGTSVLQTPLTNLQLELLKLFAQKVEDEDLIAIRNLIAQYFAAKAMRLADEIWEKKGWTDEQAEIFVHTKMRKQK